MDLSKVTRKNNRRMRAALIGVFIGVTLGGVFLLVKNRTIKPSLKPFEDASQSPIESFASLEDIQSSDYFNVLLLGYGGAGHEGGYLTDVLLLAHVDFTKDTLALISIPRDLWVKLPNGRLGKINSAFVKSDAPQYPTENVSLDEAIAGAVKTKSVIEDVTGLSPHFFVGIDFTSFVAVVDKLGGVEVDVPEAFEDEWYPVKGRELELCDHTPEDVTALTKKYSGFELEKQFPCRYEHIIFDKGIMNMNGEIALKFVRSRHGSSSGDFSRSRRQQALLLGLRDGLLSRKALEDPVGLLKIFSSSVRTNLNENLVKKIVPLLSGIGKYKVVNIYLSTENVLTQSTSPAGAFILVSKDSGWGGVQEYIKTELGK